MNLDYTHIIARRERKEAAKRARIERTRASMQYRAVINIDFTAQKETEYQRLVTALMQLGWKYLETSALAYEGDLPNVLIALEVIGKQCEASGILSALTFHVQGSTNLGGKPYPQSKSYKSALRDIRKKPLPEQVIPSGIEG